MRRTILLVSLVVSLTVTAQEEADQGASEADTSTEQAGAETVPEAPVEQAGGVKTLSGISILGNEEAPKSLVIVPWKSSQIGDGLGVTDAMDDRARPVDKEVFMREVRYYELRSGTHD